MTDMAIVAWEDDPAGSVLEKQPPMNAPVRRARPDLDAQGFPVGVDGPVPPARDYDVGTKEFRYWALADALARGAAYWSACVPAGTTWQPDNGPRLIAFPDDGVDLNAYYDRHGLHFFHGTVRDVTVYSQESPDVVCHELGHAVLDAIKPQLWDATSIEVASFHESFGDCSAILSNLQVPSLRDEVLAETGGRLATASRLSRLAESLGWAIRQLLPDATAADCLRSAVNSFYYQPPATLPPRAPASSLSSEPHNFSRIFTAGFLRVLAGMFAEQGQNDSNALRRAAQDAGTLLVDGVRRSPVVPAFYAQVAANMVAADHDRFGGRYRRAIRSGFTSSGVLSVRSAATLGSDERVSAVAALAEPPEEDVARLLLSGGPFGLSRDVIVHAAAQPRRFGVTGGMADGGEPATPAPEEAAASFVEDLIRRGRIYASAEDVAEAPIFPGARTTHEITAVDGALELRRTQFDCGFGLH